MLWPLAEKYLSFEKIPKIRGYYSRVLNRGTPRPSLEICEFDKFGASAISQANIRWENLLNLDTKSELALSNLASNYITLKDVSSAKSILQKYESLPQVLKPERLFELQARLHGIADKHLMAIEQWEKAIEHGAEYNRCKLAMLNHALSARDFDLAHVIIDELEGSDVDDEELRIAKARLNIYTLNWSGAIDILQELDSFVKRKSVAVDLLYRCYMNDYRHQSALSLCESLDKELHPQQPFMLGKVRYRLNEYRSAIDLFTSKIVDDQHIESRVWLIKSLYAANEMNSAVAQAELTSRLQGLDDLTCAKCWEAAGKLKLAQKHYELAVDSDPNSENLQALVNYLFRYRLWGEAYSVIIKYLNEIKDIPELVVIHETIVAACTATNTPLPISRFELEQFDFRSSEKMVTGIVDELLEYPPEKLTVADKKSEKKKIIFLINSLGPGGAERQVVNLANGIAENNIHDVTVLCTYLSRLEQDCFYRDDVIDNVLVTEYYDRSVHLTTQDVPEIADYSRFIELIQPISRQQLILHMASKLSAMKPDVVHGWLDETFINTALVCRMLGIDCVVGRWGSMPPGIGRTVTERDENNIEYLQHAYREIARLPDLKYCSNSRLTGDAYAELLEIPPNNVSIVYNGIDVSKLEFDSFTTEKLKKELLIPKASTVIGTVFRISDEKRPKLWIDIAKELLVTHPDLHFVMVGTGPLEGQIDDYVKSSGCSNIHLVGKQSNVGAWMNMFDLFVLTSRVEGVSNAVLEAQFCSCPVVAPNVGGLGEAIQHRKTGILLEDHSVDSFANAIKELLENPKLVDSYANNAKVFAQERFSIDSMVKSYLEIFGIDN